MPTVADLARDAEYQRMYNEYKYRGNDGSIEDFIRDHAIRNPGSVQLENEYNSALYNDSQYLNAYNAAIGQGDTRDYDSWVRGWVEEHPELAAERGIIDPDKARDLAALDELNNYTDEDFKALQDAYRAIGRGESLGGGGGDGGGGGGGGGFRSVSWRPVTWQDATWSDVGYNDIEFDDVSSEALQNAILDTWAVRDQNLQSALSEGELQSQIGQVQNQAIDQQIQDTLARGEQARVRDGFVGGSSFDQANTVRATSDLRQNSAMNTLAAKLKSMMGVNEARQENTQMLYDTGVQSEQTGLDTSKFNTQGNFQADQTNAGNRLQADITNAQGRSNTSQFNSSGRFNASNVNSQGFFNADQANAAAANAAAGRAASAAAASQAAAAASQAQRLSALERLNQLNSGVLSGGTPSGADYYSANYGAGSTQGNPAGGSGAAWQGFGQAMLQNVDWDAFGSMFGGGGSDPEPGPSNQNSGNNRKG